MERRNPNTSSEELIFAKAAAWTWYQQGEGPSEKKPADEFNLVRTWRAPGPSRYKLEAVKMADEHMAGQSSSSSRSSSFSLSSRSPNTSLSPSHTNNSLLDPYEVGRISKHLERLIESTGGNYYSDSYAGNQHGLPSSESKEKKKKSKRLINVFFVRQASVCGSRGDVVEGIMLGGQRLQQYGLSPKRLPRAKDAE